MTEANMFKVITVGISLIPIILSIIATFVINESEYETKANGVIANLKQSLDDDLLGIFKFFEADLDSQDPSFNMAYTHYTSSLDRYLRVRIELTINSRNKRNLHGLAFVLLFISIIIFISSIIISVALNTFTIFGYIVSGINLSIVIIFFVIFFASRRLDDDFNKYKA